MSEKQYKTCEKQKDISEIPFQVIGEPRDVWMTNYQYYIEQKEKGGSLRPLYGRMTDDNKFQVFIDGAWQDKNLWNDYSIPNPDKPGKKKLLFDNKKDILCKFEAPIGFNVWDKEKKARVVATEDECYVRFSKSVAEKIKDKLDELKDMGMENAFITLNYDPKKSPAEMYSVKFAKKAE